MTPEGRIKAKFKKRLEKYKPHVWGWMPVSRGYGVHGIPDWIGCAYGCFIAVEFKAGTAEPTKHQALKHLEIREAKGTVFVVRDDESMDEVFVEIEGWKLAYKAIVG